LNHDDQPHEVDRELKPNAGPPPLTSRSQPIGGRWGHFAYIASEWAEVSLGEAGVLAVLGCACSRNLERAAPGKITTDSRPAHINAAPVTEEIVPACMPMVAAVTRNGSEVACSSPAAMAAWRPRVGYVEQRWQTADHQQRK
jgi:hypothetical protein